MRHTAMYPRPCQAARYGPAGQQCRCFWFDTESAAASRLIPRRSAIADHTIAGERGTGKSMLLLQTVAHALNSGWITLYIPRCKLSYCRSSEVCDNLELIPRRLELDRFYNRIRLPRPVSDIPPARSCFLYPLYPTLGQRRPAPGSYDEVRSPDRGRDCQPGDKGDRPHKSRTQDRCARRCYASLGSCARRVVGADRVSWRTKTHPSPGRWLRWACARRDRSPPNRATALPPAST